MSNSKKIHIRTVTVERYLVPAASVRPMIAFCAVCGVESEMLTMDETSAKTGISMRDLFRLSENGLVHSNETEAGRIMFCRMSIDAIAAGEVE